MKSQVLQGSLLWLLYHVSARHIEVLYFCKSHLPARTIKFELEASIPNKPVQSYIFNPYVILFPSWPRNFMYTFDISLGIFVKENASMHVHVSERECLFVYLFVSFVVSVIESCLLSCQGTNMLWYGNLLNWHRWLVRSIHDKNYHMLISLMPRGRW